MYNGTKKLYINSDELLLNISQEEVMFQFLGMWPSLTQKFKSPFRTDTDAGCRFEWKNGLLYFIDNAGFRGKIYWNIFDIVKHVKNCSYIEALHHIAKGRFDTVKSIPVEKQRVEIRFTYKPFPENNIFFLSNDLLLQENVYLVDRYSILKNGEWKTVRPKDLCIAYYFPETGNVKLYYPYREENKWFSNCTPYDIWGLSTLNDSGDLLIISKSQKDRLTLKYHYNIENVIALQNEGIGIPPIIIDDLKSRFKRIVIIFDNDIAGYEQAQKLSAKHNIEYQIIESDVNDIYDKFTNKHKLVIV